jgi:hypothetical protein
MLWDSIAELYALLVARENSEASYQEWAERNLVVFEVLGFDAVKSFEKKSGNKLPFDADRNFSPEPDFICANLSTGVVTVFDFKTPYVSNPIVERSDGNRKKFNASLESYISQVLDYTESIEGRTEARAVIQRELGVARISAYRRLLVYGLSEGVDEADVARLCNDRKTDLEIIFFDRLLERLIARYETGRPDAVREAGICVLLDVVLAPKQLHEKAFICDYGSVERDRLSMCIENGRLILTCLDSQGRAHQLEGNVAVGVSINIRFQCCNAGNGAFMSLALNNEEQDLRIKNSGICFQLDFSSLNVGADINGKNGARFQMLEHMCYSQTLGTVEKLQIYHYSKSKIKHPHPCVEFNGVNSMVRDVDGNLRPRTGSDGPTYREDFGYPSI